MDSTPHARRLATLALPATVRRGIARGERFACTFPGSAVVDRELGTKSQPCLGTSVAWCTTCQAPRCDGHALAEATWCLRCDRKCAPGCVAAGHKIEQRRRCTACGEPAIPFAYIAEISAKEDART